MRPVSLWMPWKPAITATCLRSLKRLISSAPLTSLMRAEPCASSVRIGNCQPCQERALTPMPSSTIASSPAVTCSPEATTASYSRASCSGAASRHQATSSLVLPDMAETTTATSWPASTSRLTWRATLRMRSRSATDVPPNFMTRRAIELEPWTFPGLKGAYSYRRGGRPATMAETQALGGFTGQVRLAGSSFATWDKSCTKLAVFLALASVRPAAAADRTGAR